VTLPRQYNTNLANGSASGGSLTCSSLFFNVSDNISDFNNADNTGTEMGVSSCSVGNNLVTSNFDSVTNTTFGGD